MDNTVKTNLQKAMQDTMQNHNIKRPLIVVNVSTFDNSKDQRVDNIDLLIKGYIPSSVVIVYMNGDPVSMSGIWKSNQNVI